MICRPLRFIALSLTLLGPALALQGAPRIPNTAAQDADAPPNDLARQFPDLVAPAASPDAQGPLADPVLKTDAKLSGNKATVWNDGAARMILLEGDATFELGVYGFRGDKAVVRIDSQHLPGRVVRHLSIYFEMARPLRGAGPVQAEAPRLLVTGSTTGKVELTTDLPIAAAAAPDDPLVAAAAARVRRYRVALARPVLDAPTDPLISEEIFALRDQRRREIASRQLAIQTGRLRDAESALAAAPRSDILPRRGAAYFHTEAFAVEHHGEDESALMLLGGARIAYEDFVQGRSVALKAQRIVVFIEGDYREAAQPNQVAADRIRGIYLEDNVVVTDGVYTVRAPRMYFDVQDNRAVLLDAVLYTYDVERQVPLYMRAEVLRQTSATSFEAQEALLTTSEFAEPHFAIAARRVTVEQTTDEQGQVSQRFEAQDISGRLGKLPLGWWPVLGGEGRDFPLTDFTAGYSGDNGPTVETTWDLFALAGRTAPDGVTLRGLLDYFGEHGPGMGVAFDYDLPEFFGKLDAYLIPYELGEDDLGSGRVDVDHEGDTRGFIHAQHRHYLPYDIEVSLEVAAISDETFLEEFFPDEAYTAKEYETSIYVKKQEDDWALTLLGRYDLTDFIPQLTVLQAPGYTVDRLPELGFFVEGVSFWGDRLTYYTENRVSRMKARFGNDTPADRGFTEASSMALFGISATDKFSSRFPGFPTDWVTRVDTRHEVNAPLIFGPVNVTPYAVGRITAYDQDFDAFSGETDQVRFWGQVGTRFHTQFNRSFDDVSNELLNVNRMRHIVELFMNVFATGTTIDAADLPTFDQDVEAINQGSGVMVGMRNTLQTQRGGDGRWRSVDWIVLETRYLFVEGEETPRAVISRYFDYRPEYSVGGDHFYTQLLWMVTDNVAVSGELTYGTDAGEVVFWRINTAMDHTPNLSHYISYGEIESLNSKLLSYGFVYKLTTKYTVSFGQTLDFGEDESREVQVVVERRLPRWRARVIASFDEVDDDTFVGVQLIPEGLGGDGRIDPLHWR